MNKHYPSRKLLKQLTFLLLCCGWSLMMQAQTNVWIGNSSSWADPTNWSLGTTPTTGETVIISNNPQGGNFPIYDTSPIVDYAIQNFGTVTFSSVVYNTGTLINGANSSMINNSQFVNAGMVTFDNDGLFDNNGSLDNYGTFDNGGPGSAPAIFNNNTGSIIRNFGTFRNTAILNNDGSIINNGTLRSTNNLQNMGSISNFGLVDNPAGSMVNNASGASISNGAGAEFRHNGALPNNGTIDNSGIFIVQNAGMLNNLSTFTNHDELRISGIFDNNNTLSNNGTISIADAGTLENNNNVQNNGTIETSICGVIIQSSGVTIGGPVLNDGIIYTLNGNVTGVDNLDFGEVFNNINDKKPPVPGCKPGVVLTLDENNEVIAVPDDVDKGGYGQCGATIANRTVVPNTFGINDLGQQVVTLTMFDSNNNTSQCDAIITIIEPTPPIVAIDDADISATCPNDVEVTALAGASSAMANWVAPTASTNCLVGGGGGGSTSPICAIRTASNVHQCSSGRDYGFYLTLDGYDYHYAVSNTQFVEFEDGTANYTGTITNLTNSNIIFNVNLNLSGRTTNTPTGSPKTPSCTTANTNDWYYYTGISGTMVGAGQVDGAILSVARFGEAFQIGAGASVTDDQLQNGASAWLSINLIKQPVTGTNLTVSSASNGQQGDINVRLSGNSNPCNMGLDCSQVQENISNFIYMGEHNGSKYYCTSASNLTWSEANTLANNSGGHLAVVNNAAENNFIQNNLLTGYGWIGFEDGDGNGVYNWVNGDPVNYTNWNDTEPNESGATYVRLLASNGKWTDRNRHFEAEAVMEIPCPNTPPVTPPLCNAINDQLSGFTYMGQYDDGKYFASNNLYTWQQGHDIANALGGYLTVVNDQNENNFIQNNMTQESAWIGYEDSDGNGSYNWVNGLFSSFINWNAGEPNGSGPHFARILQSNGQWTDRDQHLQLQIIVEIPCGNTIEEPVPGDITIQQISGPSNGQLFPLGETPVAYRITDECGNEEICVFNVNIIETPAEINLDCPANVTVNTLPGAPTAPASWIEPTGNSTCFNDGFQQQRSDQGPDNGGEFPIGATFVSYSGTDSCFNFIGCTFSVTVNAVPASLTLQSCPEDIFISTSTPTNVSWNTPTANSNCYTGSPTIEQIAGPANNTTLAVGEYQVIYLIRDGCGNTELCFFNITVGCQETGDSCDDNDPCTVGDAIDEDCNCVGTYQDTDGDGVCDTEDICEGFDDNADADNDGIPDGCDDNQCFCGAGGDESNPVFDFIPTPGPFFVSCDADLVRFDPSANDNCDGNIPVIFTETIVDGTCTNTYTLTWTWTATDACGNQAQTSTVYEISDQTAPVLTGVPTDVTVNFDAVPNIPAPGAISATDNCDTDVLVTFEEIQIYQEGDCTDDYTLTRVWTAIDDCGNSASGTQVITVIGELIDTDGDGVCDRDDVCEGFNDNEDNDNDGIPNGCDCDEVICNIIGVNSETCEGGSQPYGIAEIFGDNVSGDYSYLWSDGQTTETASFPAGTHSVTVTDNVTGCSCSSDITLTYSLGIECEASVAIPISTEGGNDGSVTVTSTETVGANTYLWSNGLTAQTITGLSAGTYTVTVTSGTFECICVSTVVLEDGSDISLDACPENITYGIPFDHPQDGDVVTWTEPSASTTCPEGGLTITQTEGLPSGSFFASGIWHDITYTIEDACGNIEECSFRIFVGGEVGYTSCPADIEIAAQGSTAIVTWTEPVPETSCGSGTGTETFEQIAGPTNGSAFPIGTTEVAYLYTDICGNEAECSFDVTVTQTCTPGTSCDDGDACTTGDVYDNDCNCVGVFEDTDNDGVCNANDICEGFDDNIDTDGDGTPDGCDNNCTCGAGGDFDPPTFVNPPADITIECSENIPLPADVTAIDNCSSNVTVALVNEEQLVGECPGTFYIIRNWIASDDCGNGNSIQQNITVIDSNAPVFLTVPADVTVTPATIPNDEPTIEDNCDSEATLTMLETQVFADNNCTDDYTLTRTWVASDLCGNESTATQVITVIGDIIDNDGDGVCNAEDICEGFDDNMDTDGDGIPDGCDEAGCEDFILSGATTDVSCNGANDGSINLTLPCTPGSGGGGGASGNLAEGKPATQSSTNSTGTADLAVDGNTSGNWWADFSISSTNWTNQPYWEVDLGENANIDDVEVWGRTDCCQSFLSNYHVLISNTPFTATSLSGAQSEASADFPVAGGVGGQTIIPTNTTGRYVRIQLQGSAMLQLAEVKVNGSTDGGGDPTCDLTINWDNGLGDIEDPSGLSPGFYSVTVTSAEGCMATQSFVISEPPALNVTLNVVDITSNGANDGIANLDVDGGTAPYSYSWSTGATTPTVTGLAPGNHSFTITDANACTVSNSFIVTEPDDPCANFTCPSIVSSPISTPGGSDGTVSVSASGASNSFEYLWNDGQTTATAVGLSAGIYDVTVTDTNIGCTCQSSITLVDPDGPGCEDFVLSGTVTDISCNGANDGSIDLTLPCTPGSGGGGGASGNLAEGKPATQSSTNSTGTADLAVDGNTSGNWWADFSISSTNWTNQPYWEVDLGENANIDDVEVWGRTDCCQSFLSNYHVLISNTPFTATSLSGAQSEASADFPVAGGVGGQTIIPTNTTGRYVRIQLQGSAMLQLAEVKVNGSTDGGGDPTCDLTINWDNGLGDIEDPSGLSPGFYSVTVTSADGCIATQGFAVNEPQELTGFREVTEISATDANDGAATLTPSGGTAPYTYQWSHGPTTATVTGLSPGDYSFTVTDANGCTDTNNFTLNNPGDPCSEFFCITVDLFSETCVGGEQPDAIVNGIDGSEDYSYLWSDGQTTQRAEDLIPGTYGVTVTDNVTGCICSSEITVFYGLELTSEATVTSPISTAGASDGEATVTSPGIGTGSENYLWSNGQTTATAIGLSAGTYTVTVTNDTFGCTSESSVTLTDPSGSGCEDFVVTGTVTDISCTGQNDGSILLDLPCTTGSGGGGTGNLAEGKPTIQSSDNGNATADLAVDGNTNGVWFADYSVSSTGWTNQPYWEVDLGAVSSISDIEVWGRTDCCQSFLSNYHVLISDTPFTAASLSGAQSEASADFSEAGGVGGQTVIPVNTTGRYVRIQLQGAAMLQLAEVKVNGGGSTGGGEDCNISWDNGLGDNAHPQNLAAGVYNVTVSNDECQSTARFIVHEPAILTCSTNGLDVSAAGANDGVAMVSVNGGTAPFVYLWSDGKNSATIEDLSSGIYYVTVTDANGCTCESAITINEPVCQGCSSITMTCPNNITTTQADANGAVVYWTTPNASTDCATSGVVDIQQTAGFDNNSTFPLGETIVSYSATDDCGTTATCSFTVTVIEDTGGGEMPEGYCNAQGNSPWVEWITGVEFGDIENVANNGKDLYGDYTHMSATVLTGESYPITLTPGFSWTMYDEHWSVWIDLNRDGDLDDAGELVLQANSMTTVIGAIAIPATASTGTTLMRISMQRGAYANDPCENVGNGEVEDYAVNIVSGNLISNDEMTQFRTSNPTSISGISFNLFPNPAQEKAYLDLSAILGKEDVNIQVFDHVGHLVRTVKMDEIQAANTALDLNGLVNGVYFVTVQVDGERSIPMKLVVL